MRTFSPSVLILSENPAIKTKRGAGNRRPVL